MFLLMSMASPGDFMSRSSLIMLWLLEYKLVEEVALVSCIHAIWILSSFRRSKSSGNFGLRELQFQDKILIVSIKKVENFCEADEDF